MNKKSKDPFDDGVPMEEKLERFHNFKDCLSTFALQRKMMQETLMTNLAPRIYRLSHRHYSGCGFHYGLEQQLGKMIDGLAVFHTPTNVNMNIYPQMQNIIADTIITDVLFEELCEKVIEAERSADKLDPVRDAKGRFVRKF